MCWVVSHIAEEILGNEDSIARLTAKNKPLANRIYERIKSFIKAFKGTNADKATVARLRKAEQLFAKALENTGKAKAELYEKQGKVLDNSLAVQYSGKGYAKKQFSFQYGNFPSDKVTHNTAHQDALHWARDTNVEVKDQRLIHSNGSWYIVEKFDNFLNNYQVVEKISDAQFVEIFEEIKKYGRSGKIKSISKIYDGYDKFDKSSYSLKARGTGVDSNSTRYGRENQEMVRVAETSTERGERFERNGSRDSQGSSFNRERGNLRFSLKIGNETVGTNGRYEFDSCFERFFE